VQIQKGSLKKSSLIQLPNEYMPYAGNVRKNIGINLDEYSHIVEPIFLHISIYIYKFSLFYLNNYNLIFNCPEFAIL